MSDIFFEELSIKKPKYNLGIGGGTHGQNTGRMLEKIEEILIQEKPDQLIVYGDTDSTIAGALAAAKLHIPVNHIEAGLRSFNRKMPEELNRVLTDHLSSRLFTPSSIATSHLKNEGISGEQVQQVGDIMFDTVLHYTGLAEEKSQIISNLKLEKNNYVLATFHRPENTDVPHRLKSILKGFSSSPMDIVVPLHPRTKKMIESANLKLPDTFKVIEPVGYLDMLRLQKNSF